MTRLLVRALTFSSVVALLMIAAAGCGTDAPKSAKQTSAKPKTTKPKPGDPPEAQLHVTVRETKDGETYEGDLKCPHNTRELSPASMACAALMDPHLLDEPAQDMACTEIYGGPETATISGTLNGEEIDLKLDRTDGCRIDQWERALPVLRVARESLGGGIRGGGEDASREEQPQVIEDPPVIAGR